MKLVMEFRIVLMTALVLMTVLFCNGCWDRKELNQLALSQVVAIDYVDAAYQVTVQLIIPNADKETITSENLWNMTGYGPSVGEAMQQIAKAAPREIYLDHLDLVLLGESVLSHSINQALEYLMQENVLRRRTKLLAVEGNGGQLLIDSTELAKMDIFYIDNLLKDQQRRARGSAVTINDYYLSADNGLQETIAIPHIVMKSEKEMSLEGAALIQNDRLAGWVDSDWLSGYHWALGGSEIMTVSTGQEQIVVEVEKKKCKWEIVSENPLSIKADLRAKIKIVSGFNNWKDSVEANSIIKEIQMQVEAQAENKIMETLQFGQLNGIDAFGLGRWLNAWHRHLINIASWPEQFSKIPIVVLLDTTIEVR